MLRSGHRSLVVRRALIFLALLSCAPFFAPPSNAGEAENRTVVTGEISRPSLDEQRLELCVKALEAGTPKADQELLAFDSETLGKAYFHLNRWEEALAALHKAAELNPSSPVVRFFLASTFTRLKRYDEALTECRKLAEMEPNDGYVRFFLGTTYIQLGQEEKAIEEFERAAPLLPNGVFADLMLKGQFNLMRDRQRAAVAYERVTGLRTELLGPAPQAAKPEMLRAYSWAGDALEYEMSSRPDPQAYVALGLIYGFMRQYQKAAAALERATSLRPDYLDAYGLLGYVCGVNGLKQYEKSIQMYQKGLALKQDSAECLYGIADGYRWLGNRDKALEALDRVASIGHVDEGVLILVGCEYEIFKEYEKESETFKKAVELNPSNHVAWYSLGRAYTYVKQYREALEAYRRAVDLRPDSYPAQTGLGWALSNLRQFKEAATVFEGATKIQPDNADAYWYLGLAYNSLSLFDKSVPAFERAISLKPDNAYYYAGLALAYLFTGRYEKSIEAYQKGLAVKADCAECLWGMATAYGFLGDYENAIHADEKAVDLCGKKNDASCEANALLGIGTLYLMTHQDIEAEHNLSRALSIFREQKMKRPEAIALEKSALLKSQLGNFYGSVEDLKKALQIYEGLNEPESVLRAYTEIAVNSGDASESIRYAKLAIDFADQHGLGKHRDVFRSYEMLLSPIHNVPLDDQTRRTYAKKLLAMMDGSQDPLGRGKAFLVYGMALFVMGQDFASKTQLENAVRAASETNQRDLKLWAFIWLGIVEARLKNFETAQRYCLAAIDEIEYLRKSSQSLGARIKAAQEAQAVYGAAVILLERSGNEELAFDYAERARGSEFLDALGNGVAGKAQDMELVKRERFLRMRAFSIEQEINELDATKGPEESGKRAALEAELHRAQEEHALLLEKMENENPELSSFFAPSAATMKETQGMLDPDTTLLEYFFTGQQVFLWVVDRSGFKLIELPAKPADLGPKIDAYREKLKSFQPGFEKAAGELFDLLIRPAKPYIKTKRIAIVPHGKLHYLPFQALLDVEERDGKTEQHYLIEEYEIFYAPSASALKYSYDKRKPLNDRIVAFGNPDLRDRSLDLPYAERELTEIKNSFPGATIYLRKDATKARATKLSSDFSVLHFASHAELDARNPLASSIRMAASGADDGKLTVGEIFGLDLKNTSLVTLSACETGLGEIKGGDELIGLSRAFIYAGAPSIVASLWSVNDESTSKLMSLFYANLKHYPKAEALRLAQIEMIRGETGRGIVRGVGGVTVQSKTPGPPNESGRTVDGSHPFFWAPFILLGDWK